MVLNSIGFLGSTNTSRHEKELLKWTSEGCGRDYKRKDHFTKHMLKCCASANSASFLSEEIHFNESGSNLDTNQDVEEMDYDESAKSFEDMDIHFHITSEYALEINVNEDRKQKQRVRKDKSRRTLALEKIINCTGNKEEQNQVLHNVYQRNIIENVAYSNSESKLERIISEGFLTYFSYLKQKRKQRIFECFIRQYESGGTFFIGFLIEYLAKLNAITLIIYSSRPFNVVCELQEFALRGSD